MWFTFRGSEAGSTIRPPWAVAIRTVARSENSDSCLDEARHATSTTLGNRLRGDIRHGILAPTGIVGCSAGAIAPGHSPTALVGDSCMARAAPGRETTPGTGLEAQSDDPRRAHRWGRRVGAQRARPGPLCRRDRPRQLFRTGRSYHRWCYRPRRRDRCGDRSGKRQVSCLVPYRATPGDGRRSRLAKFSHGKSLGRLTS